MGSLHDAVMQFVERQMKKDPGVRNATPFAGAREIDESIGELRPQQFHAKYRLPVARRMTEQRRPTRQPKSAVPAPEPETPPEPEVLTVEETTAVDAPPVNEGDPVAVRHLLLDLAKELNSCSVADDRLMLRRESISGNPTAESRKLSDHNDM